MKNAFRLIRGCLIGVLILLAILPAGLYAEEIAGKITAVRGDEITVHTEQPGQRMIPAEGDEVTVSYAVGADVIPVGTWRVRKILTPDSFEAAAERADGQANIGMDALVHATGEAADTQTRKVLPKASLGVTIRDIDADVQQTFNLPSNSGALVLDINPDSAAQHAGIQSNDVILSIDNESIANAQAAAKAIAQKNPGDVVTLVVSRGGQFLSVTATLGKKDLPAQ